MFCAEQTSQCYISIEEKLKSIAGSISDSSFASTGENVEKICSFAKLVTTYFFSNFAVLESEQGKLH